MWFQSHVPDFVDADPAIPKQEFTTLEALLSHPWIKGWNKGKKDFAYYWDPNNGVWSKACLMAMWVTEKGKHEWWVLGYMDEIPKSLPKWEDPEDDDDEDED